MTHKRKPGQRVQYTARRRVVLPNGESRDCVGGTQKIDGFWSSLRRLVGRVPVNTGAQAGDSKRARFHRLVRVAQWHWWHLGQSRFEALGKAFKRQRDEEAGDFF